MAVVYVVIGIVAVIVVVLTAVVLRAYVCKSRSDIIEQKLRSPPSNIRRKYSKKAMLQVRASAYF